jgi:calcium-dependent protein kinase
MIDFGIATKVKSQDSKMTQVTGSPFYIAPEILRANYNLKCDIWAIGVMMFVIITSSYPFNGSTNQEVFGKIIEGNYKLDQEVWKNYSKDAKNFLICLLESDVELRPSAKEAKEDVWLHSKIRKDSKYFKLEEDEDEIVNNIRYFTEQNELKKQAIYYIAR